MACEGDWQPVSGSVPPSGIELTTPTPDKAGGEGLENVTRFEVIDHNGRSYTARNVAVELSLQDAGRTLKVFVRPPPPQDRP